MDSNSLDVCECVGNNVKRLDAAFDGCDGWRDVLGAANFKQCRIEAEGANTVGSSPEEFRKFMLADLAKWAKVVKESGARAD